MVSGKGGNNRLYHNDGRDHFSDVTESSGLTSEGWGQGVCAGDYDNDGYTDLFVTYWGQNMLYRNAGGSASRMSRPPPTLLRIASLQHGLRLSGLRQ